MMSSNATLTMDLQGYWHAGSGRSAGSFADALVLRDRHQLPMVGGRHLKGLLRDAVRQAESFGWFQPLALPDGPVGSVEELLFGSASQEQGRFETRPGLLVVGDGTLPPAEAQWLAHPDQARYRDALFRRVSSTAINEQGTAVPNSLRTLEVTVPLTLQARLALEPTAVDEAHRAQQLAWLQEADPWLPVREACSLFDSLGASRTRGLGEAIVALESEAMGEAV